MGRRQQGRTDRLQLLVSEDERRMAEVVAYEMGLTVSDAIRSLIRSAHREVERRAVMAEIATGAASAKPAKRRKVKR